MVFPERFLFLKESGRERDIDQAVPGIYLGHHVQVQHWHLKVMFLDWNFNTCRWIVRWV